MPCEYCGRNCFVPIPKDAPRNLTAHVRNQMKHHLTDGMLATCFAGQRADKASIWETNYGEIMTAICAQEERATLACKAWRDLC